MWFKKSLLSKLLVGMLVAAIVPLALTITISYRSTTHSVQNQIIQFNDQAMINDIHLYKKYLDELDRIAISFYYDPVMMGYLRSKSTDDYNQKLYFADQVYAIARKRPEFRAVTFSDSRTGEVITDSTFLRLGELSYLENRSTPDNDPAGWAQTQGFEVTTVNDETLLVFHKPIIDYPRTTLLGILSIYIGQEQFAWSLQPFSKSTASPEDGSVFLFIRQDRKLLYSSNPVMPADRIETLRTAELTDEFHQFQWDGHKGIIISMTDDYKGIPLTQIRFIPSAVVHEAANLALRRSLPLLFMTLAIVLINFFLLSWVLVSPIKRLVRNIAYIQAGNFAMQPAPVRKDELGVLEQRFLTMVKGLDDLMNREYRNQLELSTARLKMLQAQINPHFLYNSLQFIATMALSRGAEDINDKIAELGFIMRYSMDMRTETVPLQMEIEQIEQYLSLQTGRFDNKLTHELAYSDEVLNVEVPKMILQPLVENSIIHGIEDGMGSGAIRIVIELDKVALTIRVIDNGKGMDQSAIEDVRKAYGGRNPTGNEQGIGLLNVLERLRLRYGDGFEWEMHSISYQETAIILRIACAVLHRLDVAKPEWKEGLV